MFTLPKPNLDLLEYWRLSKNVFYCSFISDDTTYENTMCVQNK